MRIGMLVEGGDPRGRVVAAEWADDRLFVLTHAALSAWSSEGTLLWSQPWEGGVALAVRGPALWVASRDRVARYSVDGAPGGDVDVGPILYHQSARALFASPDGSTLLLIANGDRSMGVLLDSASLARKRYVFRGEPGRMVPWNQCFEAGGACWLGAMQAYRRFDWASGKAGRELGHPIPGKIAPWTEIDSQLGHFEIRSPGGGDAYRLYYTPSFKRADGAGYVAYVWTQPSFESDEFEQRAWEPRRGWLLDALEVRPIDAATFAREGRAFVLGHHDALEVRAVDSGRLLARANLPGMPELIYSLPANRFVVGLDGGAICVVEATAPTAS